MKKLAAQDIPRTHANHNISLLSPGILLSRVQKTGIQNITNNPQKISERGATVLAISSLARKGKLLIGSTKTAADQSARQRPLYIFE